MLSYRHEFHAGNQADIFKHSILFSFLKCFSQKEKPFTAFDLNAASAVYNLLSDINLKTGEGQEGIANLLGLYEKNQLPKPIPKTFDEYLQFCLANYKKKFIYKGSPEIIRLFLNSDSKLILCDLHPAEAAVLKKLYKREDNIHVHKRDCYETLIALTPPKPVRGFALFDPSYELKSDYTNIALTIEKVSTKWSNGIFIIWYPILNHKEKELSLLKNRIKNISGEKFIYAEIKHFSSKIADDKTYGLKGSGIMVINPPWGLEKYINEIREYLQSIYLLFKKHSNKGIFINITEIRS